MKKIKRLLVLAAIWALATAGVCAQDFTYGDLEYSINDDYISVTVTGHVDGYEATGQLNIPPTAYYNGYGFTVTVIDDYAFYYCEGLTGALTIPNTVEEIGNLAFYHCDGLTSLTLSNALTDIGDDAFDYCGFTGTITIPASVEYIGYTPFYCCNGIEGFVVAAGNSYYDSRDNCNAIIRSYSNKLEIGCKNSTIPNSVIAIEEDAFNHVSGLTEITIPSSVTTIGGWSFWFTGLTSLNIPGSVINIGENPFGGCSALTEITVESGNTIFDSRNDCNAIIRTGINELISGCQNTIIPDDVTSIGNNAFYFCSTLSGELIIPASVSVIGGYAFEGCTGLTGSLTIPNTITEIGESAFAHCSGFNGNLRLSESLTIIRDWAFEECPGFIGNLVIPNSVTSIGSSAFEGCHGFNGSLTLPKTLESIGNFAFASCEGFKDAIALGETPATLGEYPFGGFGSSILYVPNGCVSAYENSAWSEQFTMIEEYDGTAEIESISVSIYPNPTHGSIRVEACDISNISIFNVLGEKVFEREVSGHAFDYDFSGMETGIYLIKVVGKNYIQTQRVTLY